MAKRIAQLRLIGDNTDSIEFIEHWSTNLLTNKEVLVLGIYALPGTRFKINHNNTQEIVIGASGIFTLSCEQKPLTTLYLNKHSYERLQSNTSKHFIVIDMVYMEGELK